MRFTPNHPPRAFSVGAGETIQLHDCGRIALEPNEQVTFTTAAGGEYDVARKSWGFYATPSLNARLPQFGLRAALAKSASARFFIFLIEDGQEAECQRYLDLESLILVCWLDSDEALAALEHNLRKTHDAS